MAANCRMQHPTGYAFNDGISATLSDWQVGQRFTACFCD
jgi:hypothetical protein